MTTPAEAVSRNPAWYHTLELAPGVVTPGRIDLRPVADRVLPGDLRGKRVLDVGAFDGFWSFEMESRGADVTALDVERIDDAEWPPLTRARHGRNAAEWGVELGQGFGLAAEALHSSVKRVVCNVYDLEPDAIGGPVDFAFAGAILIHLRDPVRALERMLGALRTGGEVRVMEPISLALALRAPRRAAAAFGAADTDFSWWVPNPAAIGGWLRAAGARDVRRVAIVRPKSRRPMPKLFAVYAARAPG